MTDAGSSDRPPTAPLERSVIVQVDIAPSRWPWGATWAYVCGALACLPAPFTLDAVGRFAAGWLVAVPLLGTFWASLLGSAARRAVDSASVGATVRRFADRGRRALRVRGGADAWADRARRLAAATFDASRRLRAAAAAAAPERWDIVFAAAAALAIASVLGAMTLVVVAMTIAALAAAWSLRLVAPAPDGVGRAALEIALPAVVGWVVMGGPRPMPAPLLVEGGWPVAAAWWASNGSVLTIVAAFAVVFHGLAAEAPAGRARRRATQIAVGHAVALGTLVVADRALGAGLVALAWLAQLALASERHGDDGDPLRVSAAVAMLAMLVATIAAGWH